MSDTSPTAERREQILGEVAEGLHAIFKETQRRAMECEDSDEFVRLSGSLHKIGRGLRQALALHARFEKARVAPETAPAPAAAPVAAAATPPDPQRQAIAARKAFITRGVERCVWSEYDDDDEDEEHTAVLLLRDLEDRLDDLAKDDAFLAADVDTLIAQFCQELGVAPPPRPVRVQLPPASPGDADASASPPQANGHDPHDPPADTS